MKRENEVQERRKIDFEIYSENRILSCSDIKYFILRQKTKLWSAEDHTPPVKIRFRNNYLPGTSKDFLKPIYIVFAFIVLLRNNFSEKLLRFSKTAP